MKKVIAPLIYSFIVVLSFLGIKTGNDQNFGAGFYNQHDSSSGGGAGSGDFVFLAAPNNNFIAPSTSVGIAVGNSPSNPSGTFNVDTNGNISTSGTIQVLSPTGTSTVSGALQIGTGVRDNKLNVTADRNYPASVSVGGVANITNTLNDGAGLVLYTNHTSGATGRLLVVNCADQNFDQDCARMQSFGNITTLNVVGSSTNKGVIKAETTSNFNDASASAISIDIQGGAGTAAQGLFINASVASTTGKLINARNKGTELFTITASGTLAMGLDTGFNTGRASMDQLGNVAASGTFLAQLGSAAAPVYTFTNATTTGIFASTTAAVPSLNFTVSGSSSGYIEVAPAVTVNSQGNTALGYTAGGMLDRTGGGAGGGSFNNTFIGGQAAQYMVTGAQNTAVGSRALNTNVSGVQNTAIGQGSLFYYLGSGATGFGYHSGLNATGIGNVFIGTQAGEGDSPTTAVGTNNVFIGRLTGSVFSSGSSNVGIGTTALQAVTTGAGNTVICQAAGIRIADGASNIAIGNQALQFDVSSGFNTAIGANAGNAATSQNGTYIGYASGISVGTGADNTLVGANSGFTGVSLQSGAQDTLIGSGTQVGSASQNNGTAIGYNAIVNNDNLIQLGNTSVVMVSTTGAFYAQNSIFTSSSLFATNRLVLGATSTPGGMLSMSVTGANLNSLVLDLTSSTATGVTSTLLVMDTNGRMAMGTSTPTAVLNIARVGGSTTGSSTRYIRLDAGGGFATDEPTIAFSESASITNQETAVIGSAPGASFNNAFLRFSVANGSKNLLEAMRIDKNERVSIGLFSNTLPNIVASSTLDVAGSIAVWGAANGADVFSVNTSGDIAASSSITIVSSTSKNYTVSTTGAVYLNSLQGNPATDDFLCWAPNGANAGEVLHETANCTVSSIRFKHNIQPLAGGLEAVMQMDPVTYEENGSNLAKVGFTAEQMMKIDKRLVVMEKDGVNPHTIDFNQVEAYFALAIQELNKSVMNVIEELSQLELKVGKLIGRLDKQQQEIDSLKANQVKQDAEIKELKKLIKK